LRKVYICSPYRAKDGAQLDRNIDYAQALTKQAIEAGLAPITPHLYMTQCLNEDKPEERAAGMAAGLTLLKSCDFVIVGVKYGISEGMSAEIAEADAAGIEVVNADKLRYKLEHDRRAWLEEYAKLHACEFCRGSRLHTCTSYRCQQPYREAYKYAEKLFTSG
ncbi:DUF4406 domain-containing protein, partial [uncultured Alistipes sp.]|uniref:DUF7768 domain-containing protein n=1 Tax=uncultured Alistipes sp. TaxID=538949 RepID=UPI00321F9D46